MKTLRYFLFLAIVIISCKEPVSKKNKFTAADAVKTACILTQITYCPFPQQTIEKYLPGWKIVWNPEDVGGNYAFIASDGFVYVMAIRGSLLEFSWDAFQNWFYQDLNIAKMQDWNYTIKEKSAAIAQGSYEGWKNLRNLKDKVSGKSAWDFLDSATKNETPILITGHSLGGNLATVYASYLWQQFNDSVTKRKDINVITFGAPASGNNQFANDFDLKFPNSKRFENTNDMVPKFPCKGKMSSLGNLFTPSPSAANISIGYKNLNTSLNKVFDILNAALVIIAIKNGGSTYTQTLGEIITIPLSGKNKGNEIDVWFREAAYQHFMEQYAASLDAPVISCSQ